MGEAMRVELGDEAENRRWRRLSWSDYGKDEGLCDNEKDEGLWVRR